MSSTSTRTSAASCHRWVMEKIITVGVHESRCDALDVEFSALRNPTVVCPSRNAWKVASFLAALLVNRSRKHHHCRQCVCGNSTHQTPQLIDTKPRQDAKPPRESTVSPIKASPVPPRGLLLVRGVCVPEADVHARFDAQSPGQTAALPSYVLSHLCDDGVQLVQLILLEPGLRRISQ